MYEDEFCSRLTALRMKKGVSARDMSLSIGQNSGYINHIENRQTLPSMPVFFNICEYLGISPEEFFAAERENPAVIHEIIDDLNRLSQEQLHCLAVIIHGLCR